MPRKEQPRDKGPYWRAHVAPASSPPKPKRTRKPKPKDTDAGDGAGG